MTSAERIQHRSSSIAVLGASLAIGASFLGGLVVGGPILDLGAAPAVRTTDIAAADAGRSWQEQRQQQTPLHRPAAQAGSSTTLDEYGDAWQRVRELQTPVR
ncbi:MAG: hypothetical protein ABI534_08665 [Chloroflexota bacterium]